MNIKSYNSQISDNKLFWLFQLVGWGLYASFDSGMKIYYNAFDTATLVGNMITYATGIVSTTLLRSVYKRIYWAEINLVKLVVIIFVNSSLCAVLWYYLDHIASIPTAGYERIIPRISSAPSFEYLSYNILLILTWSGIYFGVKYFLQWQYQKEETEAALLKAEVAELKLLRYQLNPHFLFNSLSSLRSFMREDKVKAEEMLSKISEFLRYSLASSNTKEVPLNEEIEAVKNYIEIEKTKHGKNLSVEIDISPLAEEYPIPILLLHPIVENAIKHGMQTNKGILKIKIVASVKNNWLNISVCNSGQWIVESTKNKIGRLGLKNVESRLNRYYPENNKMIIIKDEDRVTITLHYKKDIEDLDE